MKRVKYYFCVGLTFLYTTGFLSGCSKMLLFDPKGPIGDAERFIIITAFALMLIVVIPVIIMALLFSIKYRASNTTADYEPKWSYSGKIDLVIWLVPVAIVIALGYLTLIKTYRLDPYKPIDTGIKPINIEAVSLDWKWLFIYPDHDIAVINQLVFPVKVPLSFRITSNTVMTSFFIPQLGSQIYAMAGMQTRLHILADEPGIYVGQNQQFSGNGFAEMNFDAIATSQEEFEVWVQKAKHASSTLDMIRYKQIAKPSIGYPITYFSSVKPGIFNDIVRVFNPEIAQHLQP